MFTRKRICATFTLYKKLILSYAYSHNGVSKPDHAVLNHGRGYARIRTYYRFAALGVLVSFAFSHPSSVQATRGVGVWIMSGLFACLCAHLCSASLCFSCFIGSQVCASISIALLFVVIFSFICWLPDTVYAGSLYTRRVS